MFTAVWIQEKKSPTELAALLVIDRLLTQLDGMVWYGNSLFDITEKYIVIAKCLIKYMIHVWRLHKEYTGCSLPCSHQGKC